MIQSSKFANACQSVVMGHDNLKAITWSGYTRDRLRKDFLEQETGGILFREFRKREHTEFCSKLGEFALAHK